MKHGGQQGWVLGFGGRSCDSSGHLVAKLMCSTLDSCLLPLLFVNFCRA